MAPDFFKASDDKAALKKVSKWGLIGYFPGIGRDTPVYKIEINGESRFYSVSLKGYIDISANGATVKISEIYGCDTDGYILSSSKICYDAELSYKRNVKRELGNNNFKVLSDFIEVGSTEMNKYCSIEFYTQIQSHQQHSITVKVNPNETSNFRAYQFDIKTKSEHYTGPILPETPLSNEAFILKLLQLPSGQL